MKTGTKHRFRIFRKTFHVLQYGIWMTNFTYVLCLKLGMGPKDDIGRFPSIGGLKDMEHNMGDWDFQRITAALLLPLQ